jgi:hypothetical protein
MKNFMGVVNHCMRTIHEKEGKDYYDIVREYGNNLYNLLDKIESNATLSKVLFIPGKKLDKSENNKVVNS